MSKQTLWIIIVTAVVGVIITKIFSGATFTGLSNQRGIQGAQGTGLYGTTSGSAEAPYS